MDFGSVQFSVTFWQVLDGDRRLLYQLFSRGECRTFGWGPKEIVGQPRQTYWPPNGWDSPRKPQWEKAIVG